MGTMREEDNQILRDRKRWISCTSYPLPKRRHVQAIRKFPPVCGRERSSSNAASGSAMLQSPKKAVVLQGTRSNGFKSAKVYDGTAFGDSKPLPRESARSDEKNESNNEIVENQITVHVGDGNDPLGKKASISEMPSVAPSSVKELAMERKKMQSPTKGTLQKVPSGEKPVKKSSVGAGGNSSFCYAALQDVVKDDSANEVPAEKALMKFDLVKVFPQVKLDGKAEKMDTCKIQESKEVGAGKLNIERGLLKKGVHKALRKIDLVREPPQKKLGDKAENMDANEIQESRKVDSVKLNYKSGLPKKKSSEVMRCNPIGGARNPPCPIASKPALRRDYTDKLMEKPVDNIDEQLEVDARTLDDNDVHLEDSAEQMIIRGSTAAERYRRAQSEVSDESNSIFTEVRHKKVVKFAGRPSVSAKKSIPMAGASRVVLKKPDKGKALIYQGDKISKAANQNNQTRNEIFGFLPPCTPLGNDYEEHGNEKSDARSQVKKILKTFQVLFRKIMQADESKSKLLRLREGSEKSDKIRRMDLHAYHLMKNSNLINKKKLIGSIPGVEVGDEFHYRVEISIVGLHCPFQGGIDTIEIEKGKRVAISIVASGGYDDVLENPNELIYTGSGGKADGNKEAKDQKLSGPNLALKNCIEAKSPVRVIHGFKAPCNGKMVSTFTYDGLYMVERCYRDLSPEKKIVYKYFLRRMPNQPEIALHALKKRNSELRDGILSEDISQGQEKIKIPAINTIDNELPLSFKYITKNIYPSSYKKTPPRGCDCTYGCIDFARCACARKNGGEIPFNSDGAIVQAKPLVYECGPSCRCPPSCPNRVSQQGINIPLEIFKTASKGWGVRSLSSIPSGTFVCEYIGQMLEDNSAEQTSNDEYLFDIGHNYDDRELWEGLPSIVPSLASSPSCEAVDNEGYTIDAARCGNVGRFINHCCSPNLYAQNVLYDHDNARMPHIMFFAAENIPPLQELTYHYNYSLDQVRDSEGNIKKKSCYCGAADCSGRLY